MREPGQKLAVVRGGDAAGRVRLTSDLAGEAQVTSIRHRNDIDRHSADTSATQDTDDPLRPARGIALCCCLGFMVWGLGLAGCAAYRSSVSLEGDLDNLGEVLAADGAPEELLAEFGGER